MILSCLICQNTSHMEIRISRFLIVWVTVTVCIEEIPHLLICYSVWAMEYGTSSVELFSTYLFNLISNLDSQTVIYKPNNSVLNGAEIFSKLLEEMCYFLTLWYTSWNFSC
jgi:low affinity Fe/Cu permease